MSGKKKNTFMLEFQDKLISKESEQYHKELCN